MKNLLGIITGLFLMASCSGNSSSEKEREDSIPKVDSLAQMEAVRQAELGVKEPEEKAQVDSLSQDSSEKREQAIASIPSFNDFLKHGQNPSYFKKKGFKVSVKHGFNERDGDYKIVTGSYSSADGISCKFKDSTVGDDYLEITVNGAPDVLKKIYSDAQKYVKSQKKYSPHYEVKKKGNTIECIFDPYDY